MPTYLELKAQAEALAAQAEQARLEELHAVIERVLEIVAEYALTPDDVFGRRRGKRGAVGGQPVAPKYQDPKTGATWSGRGREPGWIKGKKRDRFLIQK
jgi:DNA-binding protein H-NS